MDRRRRVVVRVLVDFDTGYPPNHWAVVLHPVGWTNGINLGMRRVRLSQHLDPKLHSWCQWDIAAEYRPDAVDEVSSAAAGALLDLKYLALRSKSFPVLTDMRDSNGNIAQSIVMIWPILVVQATLERKSRRWNVGHNPLFPPFWFGGSPQCSRSSGQDGVFLVSCRRGMQQCRMDEGV